VRKALFLSSWTGLVAFMLTCFCEGSSSRDLILVTTTSTQDSGLLDVLIPAFEEKTIYKVKTIAIGSGQSLAMGARGEADVALVHAPELEREYLAQGIFINRRLVMSNAFIIVGPANDPAGIGTFLSAAQAFGKIARAEARFVSRGDNSGTHLLEKRLWRDTGVEPTDNWYIEAGQGMGATLMISSERQAYTLTDQGTYLAFREKVALKPLVQSDPVLSNVYHVMVVNPAKFPKVNHVGARAFAKFLVSPDGQEIIRSFGEERFGTPLFYPAIDNR
jgi:tungstate transport system substrate-binding protein